MLRTTRVLLLFATLTAPSLAAQRPRPACTLTPGELRPIMLGDGRYGMIFPVEMLAHDDSLLILGVGAVVNAAGKALPLAGDDSAIVGFLLTNRRRVVTVIPAPHNLPTARYFRTRATGDGWESVFFVPDHDTMPGARLLDAGTFWYGRLHGRRWSGLEIIGHVDSAIVSRPASSDLISRDGRLQFAVGRGDPTVTDAAATGSVMIFQRVRPGNWEVHALPVRGPSLTVTTPAHNATVPHTQFFPVSGMWERENWFPGTMTSVDPAHPASPSVIRRGIRSSMNDPVELMIDGTMHTSWWEQRLDGTRPSIWYQALDPRHENDPEGERLVVAGAHQFTFLAVPQDGRTRPVWVYRVPEQSDTAEVAVVANGEPMVVGRMAFPFGFMTNGVTSGDRSFILATTPRPIPGEGPPASRTLEVRVNCRGAPGTSHGGMHEAPVEAVRAGRRAGHRRMHG